MAGNGLYASKSITSATGSSQTLAEQNNARRELYIFNIAASSWTLNLVGGTAVAGGADCVTLATLTGLTIYGTNKVTAVGTSSAKLTVLER